MICSACRGTGLKPPKTLIEDELCVRNGRVERSFVMTFDLTDPEDDVAVCTSCGGTGAAGENAR